MIGNVYSSSPSIIIGGSTGGTYVNGFSGAQGVGNMRYNTSTQKTEVFDGTTWITLSMGTVNVALSPEVESLLQWARRKRDEELERERLAETNPTIKDLLDQIKFKEEQVKMVQTLLKSKGEEGAELMRP